MDITKESLAIKEIIIIPCIIFLSLIVSCKESNSKEKIKLTKKDSYSHEKLFFPVGYYTFHEEQLYNFNLNRWHSMGYARYSDIKEAGKRIKTFKDWKVVMEKLASRAESEGRLVNAAFYYRAAEFFMTRDNPKKDLLYQKFITLFYRVFENDNIEQHIIPYQNSYIKAIKILPKGEKRGTIVIHGGFDSFIEELYSVMKFFRQNGYEVIGFDGPGQGAALKEYGLYFDLQWEKPVRAVLDYFRKDDVTLIGFSLGGYLCIRASAFEPRVKRVIASSVAFDHSKITSIFEQILVKILFGHFRDFTNNTLKNKMKENPILSWSFNNMMYMYNKNEPIEALNVTLSLNEENLHSSEVKQDVLILTGKDDHLVPSKMHNKQIKALINAKSITDYIFTKKEQGQNHCQIGNVGLALNTMLAWINDKSM